jgi:hypothetical protein
VNEFQGKGRCLGRGNRRGNRSKSNN